MRRHEDEAFGLREEVAMLRESISSGKRQPTLACELVVQRARRQHSTPATALDASHSTRPRPYPAA